jgi:hypothetical protein
MIATWQAAYVGDAEVRRAMAMSRTRRIVPQREARIAVGLPVHEKRLRLAFRHILLLSLGAPAAAQVSCGSDENGARASDGGLRDATTRVDGAEGSAPDVAGDSAADVDDGDAGLDAAMEAEAQSCQDAMSLEAAPLFATCGEAGVMSAPYYHCSAIRQCYYYVDLSCPTYPFRPGCYLSASDCLKVCGDGGFFDCVYTSPSCGLTLTDSGYEWQMAEAGPYTIGCGTCPNVGRRPAGLQRPRNKSAASALGYYFARASHLEAASVHAFERLYRELRGHRAPRNLLRAAERSARDEVRHAHMTARLARQYGSDPPVARVRRQGARSLERMARENVVEGCVRETFGALVATWQADHAADRRVRACMTRIATDETRHAALAWAVAQWAEPLLDRGARDRVKRAQRSAIAKLQRDIATPTTAELVREAGLPDPLTAGRLLEGMLQSVWA